MTTYRYKGQTPEGSKVSGVIRAYDEYDAVSKLRDTCAFVIKLEEVREKKDSVLTRPLRTRIKEKDLALICSQFSIILGTGLPVMRGNGRGPEPEQAPGADAPQGRRGHRRGLLHGPEL